jgi:D-glycero-alpha-D-manno-heptose-7-phosphate kinase
MSRRPFFVDMQSLIARAPTRLDFGGGWTDVPPYSSEQGGCVCNVAIARHAVARVRPSRNGEPPAAPAEGRSGDHALALAALRRARIPEIHVVLTSDFPVGAGLGGSSAAGVAVLGALGTWRGDPIDPAALAEQSRQLEVEDLGIPGGRQDHYAAAFGGALGLWFDETTTVRQLPLSPAMREAIERRCIVAYTGQSRISGDTITAVIDAYRAREARVLSALARMKALAASMIDAFGRQCLDDVAALVGEHWASQRALHPAIPTPVIDELLARAAAAGAIGGKALGASGGGCVLAIAADGCEDAVRRAMTSLAEPLEIRVDERGFRCEPEDVPHD